MISHCLNPKTGEPEPMKYVGGDDYHCPVCLLSTRYCKECLYMVPLLQGKFVKCVIDDGGLSLRTMCGHHVFNWFIRKK